MLLAIALAFGAGVVLSLVADLCLFAVHFAKIRREVVREQSLLGAEPTLEKPPSYCIEPPVFNEAKVGAAIVSLCRLKWPHERLEILVLDDSTSESMPRLSCPA
jgi:hypothetical protein